MMPHPPQMRRDFSASLIQISAMSAVNNKHLTQPKNERRKPRMYDSVDWLVLSQLLGARKGVRCADRVLIRIGSPASMEILVP